MNWTTLHPIKRYKSEVTWYGTQIIMELSIYREKTVGIVVKRRGRR
jgi:hypothetical protein